MGHQAEDVAGGVDDAGDIARRAVRVRLARHPPLGVAVAEDDLPVALELIEGSVVGEVVSLAMRDRHAKYLAGRQRVREGRAGLFRAEHGGAAYKAQVL